MLQEDDANPPGSFQKISVDIWKFRLDSFGPKEHASDKKLIDAFLPDPQDRKFHPEDQVYFKFIIRHSDGTLFQNSHEFYPYFPKLTDEKTGPCKGMRTAINTMETGEIATFRFFGNAALSWAEYKDLILDEEYLNVEIEILAIERKKRETPLEAFDRFYRTKNRAVSYFKAKDILKALFLFKTVEYHLAFLRGKLNLDDQQKCMELLGQVHSNAAQCFLNLREPHMALRELETFDDIANEHTLPHCLCEKAAYRKCIALTKTNRYEDAEKISNECILRGFDLPAFQSIVDCIKKSKRDEELLFKKMFSHVKYKTPSNQESATGLSLQKFSLYHDFNETTPSNALSNATDIVQTSPVDSAMSNSSAKMYASSTVPENHQVTSEQVSEGTNINEPSSIKADNRALFDDANISILSQAEAQNWAGPGDCDDDFIGYVPPVDNEVEYREKKLALEEIQEGVDAKDTSVPTPPSLNEILDSIAMDEINRILHKFFHSKGLFSVVSLIQVLSIHSHEVVYWSKVLLGQSHHLMDGLLRKMQDLPLIQFFDRTPTKENALRIPIPVRFSPTTPILIFIDSEILIRFCLADSFEPTPFSASAALFFENAKDIQSFLRLVPLDDFYASLSHHFPPYDSYRIASIVKTMALKIVIRPVLSLYDDLADKEAIVLGYLRELCKSGKLDLMLASGKQSEKPKLYVRGEEKLSPIEL